MQSYSIVRILDKKAHLSLSFVPAVKFALKGGLHIDNSVRNRVAEKNVEPIPKIQKTVLSVLDMVFFSLVFKTNKPHKLSKIKPLKRTPCCFVTSPDCEVHASSYHVFCIA